MNRTQLRRAQITAVRRLRDPRTIETQQVVYTGRTKAGTRINIGSSMTIAAVWACVRYLSQSIAGFPWQVRKPIGSEGRSSEVWRSHPVNYLVTTRSSAEWSSFQFRETMMHWALLRGNGYAEIERDVIGRPVNMYPIHPDRVDVRRNDETQDLFYLIDGKTILEPMDVFHVRAFGDGPVGLNFIAYAAESLGWAKAAQLFGSSFFGNGATPAGIVTMKRALSPDGLAELEERFDYRYGGPSNSNKTIFLDNEMAYQAISTDPEKGQFLETNEYLVTEIARWFGVPPHKIYQLLHATFCLPADAIVTTENGPKRIVDVKVGDLVWSVSSDGKFELKPVLKSGLTGQDQILTIKTRGRTLRCNANHRVMVRRMFWDPDKKARGPYTLVDGVKCQKNWRNEYIEAGNLKIGDLLVCADELPSGTGKLTPTREATIDFMEMIGHLIGDGFFARNYRTKKLTLFGISHAVDDKCGEYYAGCVERSFQNVERYDHGRPARNVSLTRMERDENTTVFNSVAACAELDACGVVGTAKTKRVPVWVFGLERDLQAAFLRGYLDADGTVNKIGQTRFVSANRNLLIDVAQLCAHLGVRCGEVFETERDSEFEGYDKVRSSLYSLICSNAEEMLAVGSNEKVRKQRLEYAATNYKDREVETWGNEKLRKDVGKGLRTSKVILISITEENEDVYDLTVQDNHCFIANGVVVHNSNIEHQSIEVVIDSLRPWAKRFEDEADYKLFGPQNRQGAFTRMDFTDMLRGDTKTRLEYYRGLREIGVLNTDEIREFEDMQPVGKAGGGGKRVMQSQYTTLEMIGEAPLVATSPDPVVPAVTTEPDPVETDDPVPEPANLVRGLTALHRSLAECPAI